MRELLLKYPLMSWSGLFIILLSIYLFHQNTEIEKLSIKQNNLQEKISTNNSLKVLLTDSIKNHSVFQTPNSLGSIAKMPNSVSEINQLIDSLIEQKNEYIRAVSIDEHIEHCKEDTLINAYINQLNHPILREKILLIERNIKRVDSIINTIIMGSMAYLMGIFGLLFLKRSNKI